MKKVFILELDAECSLVSCYADLKNRDIIKLVRSVYLNPVDTAAKLALLRQLFTAPDSVWKQLEAPENHEQLWRLLNSLNWVWKGPQLRPVSSLRIRGRAYFLPDQDLYQLSTAEFVIGTAHLIGFHTATSDATAVDSLSKFVATIARPKPDVLERIRSKQENGDLRETFSAVKAERRGVLFDKVDLVTRILIAQWFNNAANQMLNRNGTKGDDDGAPISQGIFVQDWERQVVRVAESQVYGNFDQVMQRPILDVLSYIEVKNDEIRRKIEAGRKQG